MKNYNKHYYHVNNKDDFIMYMIILDIFNFFNFDPNFQIPQNYYIPNYH